MTETFRIGGDRFSVAPPPPLGGEASGFVVRSGAGDYEVRLAAGQPGPAVQVAALLDGLAAPLVVADEVVLAAHLPDGVGAAPCHPVVASEATKSLDGAVAVLDFLAGERAGRATTVVAIGGGVVQDVTGFACGVYKRGLSWCYVPTTLLAQADSCIGGKTAVNFRRTKNLLGLFCAPGQVLSHPGFLSSLAPADLRSGLGEILKLCAIGGEGCLARFEDGLAAALAGDLDVVRSLAALSLAVKWPVIEADERDVGARRALNLGHSVGHAVEATTGYEVPHGVAVTLGTLVESELARRRGLLEAGVVDRLTRSARLLVTETEAAAAATVAPEALWSAMGGDKKVEGSVLKLPVPVALGAVELVDLPLDARGLGELESALGCLASLR